MRTLKRLQERKRWTKRMLFRNKFDEMKL